MTDLIRSTILISCLAVIAMCACCWISYSDEKTIGELHAQVQQLKAERDACVMRNSGEAKR